MNEMTTYWVRELGPRVLGEGLGHLLYEHIAGFGQAARQHNHLETK